MSLHVMLSVVGRLILFGSPGNRPVENKGGNGRGNVQTPAKRRGEVAVVLLVSLSVLAVCLVFQCKVKRKLQVM